MSPSPPRAPRPLLALLTPLPFLHPIAATNIYNVDFEKAAAAFRRGAAADGHARRGNGESLPGIGGKGIGRSLTSIADQLCGSEVFCDTELEVPGFGVHQCTTAVTYVNSPLAAAHKPLWVSHCCVSECALCPACAKTLAPPLAICELVTEWGVARSSTENKGADAGVTIVVSVQQCKLESEVTVSRSETLRITGTEVLEQTGTRPVITGELKTHRCLSIM